MIDEPFVAVVAAFDDGLVCGVTTELSKEGHDDFVLRWCFGVDC